MAIKAAINGTGRIGMICAKIITARDDIELVAINTTAEPDMLEYLFKYDSVHGGVDAKVIDGGKMQLLEAGLIKMKAEDLQFQIPQMVEALEQIFSSHEIHEVAMEDIFYAHNPQTVLKLAQFRGAIMLKLLQEHGQFAEYTPLQVKKALTGKAKAAKEQVAFMVQRLLNIKKAIKPLDITDAMAVAITHAQRVKLKSK